MMFLRSRRTMTAVAAAASLVLTATAVPQSPFSPVAAQAATANKTQDTTLPLKCSLFALGGPNKVTRGIRGILENLDLESNVHVTLPGSVNAGELIDASIRIDTLSVSDDRLKLGIGSPLLDKKNLIRFAVPGDFELVDPPSGVTLENGVLLVNGMMSPRRDGSTMFLDFKPLNLKFKAKKAGKFQIQTPRMDQRLDTDERVWPTNMFWAEGRAAARVGVRVNCLTDQYKPLGVTEVKPYSDALEPKYSNVTVKQQDAATAKNTAQAPAGTTYAKGANAPEWATVGQDGTVTVKPGLDVKPGDYTVPVVVTYPDSSTDNAVVNVTVKEKEKSLAEQHDPQFGETTVEREGAATIPAPEGLPEGTKVAAGEGVPEWVTVYEDGSIEAKPTRETEDKEYTVPVVVTYSDKSTDEATAKVTVTKKPDNQIYSPEFGSITVQANRSAKTPAIEGLPEGTKFALAEGAPDWASIDDKGVIELNPGDEVDVKDYTVPVTVTYPDGTIDNAELTVTVTERAINEIHDPTYTDVTVKQGDEETAPAPTDVAEGAKFAAGEGAPEWATVNEDGSVTVKPGLDVVDGTYTVPVKVSYEDGSGDDTTVNITVTVKPTNEKYNPTYPGADVKQGDETTVAPPADVADGAEFALGEGAPEWATVNDDGTVTLKPSKDVKPGDYDVPVVITYPDKSTTTTTLKVTIKEQDKQNDNTGSTGSGDGLFGSLKGSSSVSGSSAFGYFIAALFGTIAIGAGLTWLYNWARDHGYVR